MEMNKIMKLQKLVRRMNIAARRGGGLVVSTVRVAGREREFAAGRGFESSRGNFLSYDR
jgi:hypothetical protein